MAEENQKSVEYSAEPPGVGYSDELREDYSRGADYSRIERPLIPICYMSPSEAFRQGYDSPEGRFFRASNNATNACCEDIQIQLTKNYDGYRLKEGFEDGLIERNGLERIKYCLASVIVSHDWDPRYTEENKEWAKTVRVSDSLLMSRSVIIASHPGLVNILTNRIRHKDKMNFIRTDEEKMQAILKSDDDEEGWEKLYVPAYSPENAPQKSGATEEKNMAENNKQDVNEGMDMSGEVPKSAAANAGVAEGPETAGIVSDIGENADVGSEILSGIGIDAGADAGNIPARGGQDASGYGDLGSGASGSGDLGSADSGSGDAGSGDAGGSDGDDEVYFFDFESEDGTSDEASSGDGGDGGDADEEFAVGGIGTHADKVTETEEGYLVTVPVSARMRKFVRSGVFLAPKGKGLDGYRFILNDENVSENGDGTLTLLLSEDVVFRNRGSEKVMSAADAADLLAKGSEEDFKTRWLDLSVPEDAIYGKFSNMIRVTFPQESDYAGRFTVIPMAFYKEDRSDETQMSFSLPDSMNFGMRADGGEEVLSCDEFVGIMSSGTFKERTRWTSVEIPERALLHRYDKVTLFKMPNGQYEGYSFYLPNGMVTVGEKGENIILRIPDKKEIVVKDGKGGADTLNPTQFANLVGGKEDADFVPARKSPSEIQKEDFLRKVADVKARVPEKMLDTPNWVAVRLRENTDRNLDKYIKPARGNPEKPSTRDLGVGIDEAVDYGLSHNGDMLGFVFDGTGICCLELDDCLDEYGNPKTYTSNMFFRKARETTYMEKSPSGKGLHIFGTMADQNFRALSKEKDVELFSGEGYVVVTGNAVGEVKELAPLDRGGLGDLVYENFERGSDPGEMTDGDKKILDGMMKATNGETVEKLFRGLNVRGDTMFSDASLMMRLSLASRGDMDAMVRIYRASERDQTNPEYIEHLAKRAVKGTQGFLRAADRAEERHRQEHEANLEKVRREKEKKRRGSFKD